MRLVLDDRSLATALVAIQGPRAAGILAPLTDVALDGLRYYAIAEGQVAGVPALVARTGYTGEDGFEVFVDGRAAATVWDALMSAGNAEGLVPVGLGARDTLRLEAGMPLYGNELGPDTTPFEAGLGRVVAFGKEGEFVGRGALERAQAAGPRQKLVGVVVRGRGIARHGYEVFVGERRSGVVTSGTQSPTLGEPIAMAYVMPADSEPGTIVTIGIRDRRVPAEVVSLPFYKRPT
jgi:aminomethyltransferase